MKLIKKIGFNIIYVLIVLTTLFCVMADEIPYVQLEDTSPITYLNIFNYNTSVHNNLTELQGGSAPNQYYHLNLAEYLLVTTILSNVSFDLDMLDLQEGYIYVGNSSNNPEGKSSANFISEFNIGNWSDDKSDYYTSAEILGFNYYNASNFSIADYSTTAEADLLYAPVGYGDEWNKTYADTLYTNNTDTNTNCSVAGTCSEIVYYNNVSWITDNQNYNTTDEMFNAVNNGSFAPAGYGDGWNETYADTLYAKYQFANNNFNGTGNFTTTNWFNGKFNFSTADDWNSFDGSLIDFNESKLEIVYYNLNQSNIIAGTLNGGTILDTQHPDGIYDGITVNFTEVSGSPALDIRLNFTNVDDFSRGIIRYKTSSLSGDYPIIQMWNYNSSTWEDYPPIAETLIFATITQPVFDSSNHLQNGIVQMRIYKLVNGNINNHYYIDWIAISKGYGVPSGEEIDPYSWHLTDFNITDYFTMAQVLGFNYYNATDFSISDYYTKTQIDDFNYYNATDFDIVDYFTSSEILGFSYYNATDFDIADYSTTAEADLLYAPIGYGDEWNKTYADTLYTNSTDTDTNLTEDNVEAYIFDNDNTANLNMSNYNITIGEYILYANNSCFVIKVGTTYLEVCE